MQTRAKVFQNFYCTLLTYCFNVTNTGNTFLDSIVVTEIERSFNDTAFKPRAPGASAITVPVPGKIVNNSAIVTANIVTDTGKDIPDLTDVVGKDSSGMKRLALEASATIAHTVYLGNDGDVKCGTATAAKLANDYYGVYVTYCFAITNSGKSSLDSNRVEDTWLLFVDNSIGVLAPGATKIPSVGGKITAQLTNLTNVTGNPSLDDGTGIPDMADVRAPILLEPKCFRSCQLSISLTLCTLETITEYLVAAQRTMLSSTRATL